MHRVLLGWCLLAAACGSPPAADDAGLPLVDAGTPDAGPADAGAPDAGPGDAGAACATRLEALSFDDCVLPFDGGARVATLPPERWFRLRDVQAPLVTLFAQGTASYELQVEQTDGGHQGSSFTGVGALRLAGVEAGSLLRVRGTSAVSVRAAQQDFLDLHEPNDVQAVALDDGGVADGVFETLGDLDRFFIDVSPTEPILLVDVASSTPATFELLGPDGGLQLRRADRAAVRATPGRWLVQLSADGVRGDPSWSYRLTAKTFATLDPSVGNGTLATAQARALSGPGSTLTATGRLEAEGDVDWYSVTAPASSQPTLLRWELRPSAGPAPRYTVGTGPVHAVSVLRAAGGNCAACVQGPGSALVQNELADACTESTPQCLLSLRRPPGTTLAGVLQLPPHASSLATQFRVAADDPARVDDAPWELELSLQADPDEASRYSAGREQATTLLLPEQSAAGFPTPAAGAATSAGALAGGPGARLDGGRSLLGPRDYDVAVSDVDRVTFALPNVAPPLERTLSLQVKVGLLPDGGMPGVVSLALTFCDADQLTNGQCTPTLPQVLPADPLSASWWQPSTVAPWSITTAGPEGCVCVAPRFMRAGSFELALSAAARTSVEPLNYEVRASLTPYPAAGSPCAASCTFAGP